MNILYLHIGTANENPISDTRVYESEYVDGQKASLTANDIAQNMFAQVDDEGNIHVLFDEIIDHCHTALALKQVSAFIVTSSGNMQRQDTTKGWDMLIQWKDSSTTWVPLKEMKKTHPVQVSEYTVLTHIQEEPAFAWWVPHVSRKRNRIVVKVKPSYWIRTHKFGLKVPKSVTGAIAIDRENGETLRWDAICKEMKNVRITFEESEGDKEDIPPGYQFVNCHRIFDIKMGEGFRRKARMVAGVHMTEAQASLTY